jgi:hypothetical protein
MFNQSNLRNVLATAPISTDFRMPTFQNLMRSKLMEGQAIYYANINSIQISTYLTTVAESEGGLLTFVSALKLPFKFQQSTLAKQSGRLEISFDRYFENFPRLYKFRRAWDGWRKPNPIIAGRRRTIEKERVTCIFQPHCFN